MYQYQSGVRGRREAARSSSGKRGIVRCFVTHAVFLDKEAPHPLSLRYASKKCGFVLIFVSFAHFSMVPFTTPKEVGAFYFASG